MWVNKSLSRNRHFRKILVQIRICFGHVQMNQLLLILLYIYCLSAGEGNPDASLCFLSRSGPWGGAPGGGAQPPLHGLQLGVPIASVRVRATSFSFSPGTPKSDYRQTDRQTRRDSDQPLAIGTSKYYLPKYYLPKVSPTSYLLCIPLALLTYVRSNLSHQPSWL